MIRLDVVLPVLHGKLGEDGAMQGLLELSGIPYVGCDIQSSALCMDKSLAYIVARSAGIATPNYWVVTANEKIDPDRLTYPVFVKPARSGSSFGVSKVSGKEELPGAMETARQYDSKVLIEEAVVGSEVGCADPGERYGPGRRRGGPDRALARLLQDPSGERARKRLGELHVHRSRRHPGGGALARPGDGEGHLPRPGLQGARAGGHVPDRRRNGRPQRGQHPARHDLLQPLPENDGGRRPAARRGDRPASSR